MVGFWSFGGSPIIIDKVYLTNSDDYEDPTGIEDVTVDKDPLVDVYTITESSFALRCAEVR